MTQNLSRRDLFKKSAIVLPVGIGFIAASGCGLNPQGAANINVLLSTFAAAIQIALPLAEVFTPPPYNLALVAAAQFLNVGNEFAQAVFTESATMDTATQKAQVILDAAKKLILDPSVLSQLPSTFKSASGAILSTPSTIQSIVDTANAILRLFATMVPGATATLASGNAIVQLQVPTVAAAAKAIAAVNATAASAAMAPMMVVVALNSATLAASPLLAK